MDRRKGCGCLIRPLIIALVLFLAVEGAFVVAKRLFPLAYEETVSAAAAEYDVDPALIYAVIHSESRFQSLVESHAGAVGLMQLTPDTFDWLMLKKGETRALTADDLTDPEINVSYGTYFLSLLQEEFADTETALCAYNAGRSRVRAWLADPDVSSDGATLDSIPYKETEVYVKNVLFSEKMYRFLYNSKLENILG